jgi:alpha-galactosidase/6-phospho-beta-glucosidase family protein
VQAILEGEIDRERLLRTASQEAASEIIAAVVTGRSFTRVMNLPNRGQISNLPEAVVVETFGTIDKAGARGVGENRLPPSLLAVISQHVSNQEMIVEAAHTGDKSLALKALLADPLVSLDLDTAELMFDEMLNANREYLPTFF